MTSLKPAYYGYDASEAAAIAASVLFGLTFLVHTAWVVKTKTYYMIYFAIGCFMECLGYAFRCMSAQSPSPEYEHGRAWYIATTLFIILAPAILTASIYMVFGRIVMLVGEEYSFIRAKWITATFVTFDVLSFAIQGIGGGMITSDSKDTISNGQTVLIVGLVVQIVSFGVFWITTVTYQFRAHRAKVEKGPWLMVLYTLYVSCFLVMVRSIFRTAEFASMGESHSSGPLLESEPLFYCLEAVPIFLCCVLLGVIHPSRAIPGKRVLAARQQEKASQDNVELGQAHPVNRPYV